MNELDMDVYVLVEELQTGLPQTMVVARLWPYTGRSVYKTSAL
jgi:hypothetical protein